MGSTSDSKSDNGWRLDGTEIKRDYRSRLPAAGSG
jgi:hypothetical protein